MKKYFSCSCDDVSVKKYFSCSCDDVSVKKYFSCSCDDVSVKTYFSYVEKFPPFSGRRTVRRAVNGPG